MTKYSTLRVRLRHAHPDDYETLYRLESDPATITRWRYRGKLPVFGDYEAALWRDTEAILISELANSGSIAGYIQFHDLDLRAGYGFFSIYARPDLRGRGVVAESTLLFFDWVFDSFDIRWLYAYVFDINLSQFESAITKGVLHRLGTLRNRVSIDGVPNDVHVIGTTPKNWREHPIRLRLQSRRQRQADNRA